MCSHILRESLASLRYLCIIRYTCNNSHNYYSVLRYIKRKPSIIIIIITVLYGMMMMMMMITVLLQSLLQLCEQQSQAPWRHHAPCTWHQAAWRAGAPRCTQQHGMAKLRIERAAPAQGAVYAPPHERAPATEVPCTPPHTGVLPHRGAVYAPPRGWRWWCLGRLEPHVGHAHRPGGLEQVRDSSLDRDRGGGGGLRGGGWGGVRGGGLRQSLQT